MSLLRKLAPVFLAGGLLILTSTYAVSAPLPSISPAAPAAAALSGPTTSISVTVALGTVMAVPVGLSNAGQPATQVRLYSSALPVPALGAQAAAGQPLRVSLPDTPGPVAAELFNQMAAAPDGQADMLVYLGDQADLSAAASIPDWNARGEAVVNTLMTHAALTQQPLIDALRAQGYAPRSYWIVNALAVHGDRALAQWLAAQASVTLVGANTLHALDQPTAAAANAGDIAWGVAKINAPNAWADWGVQGDGIVVANIDTGVAYTHSALLTSYRGWSPQGITNDYNWYDPITTTTPCAPFDPVGHGTHTMGTIAGQAAANNPAIGVAPKVRWIAARGCGSSFCADETLLASAQWMLAPTDCHLANPRPDLRPHIINNSWGGTGDDPWYTGYVQAWNAAGIFSAFAAGNTGALTGCASTNSPGNYASAFAVGATDDQDFITDFSSRGPTSDGRIKPELSAPGLAVPSAWPDGSIKTLSGTSMATPHVAGAAALLWSANPLLIGDIVATRRALTSTVLPRPSDECGGAPGLVPNNVYGWGRLDVHQAILQARAEAPWLSVPASAILPPNGSLTVTVTLDARQVSGPGQYQAWILVVRNNAIIPIPVTVNAQASPAGTGLLTGRLTNHWTNAGVYGQLELDGQSAARTDANGYYTVTLPLGTYPLTATALGYVAQGFVQGILTDTQTTISLVPDQPHLELSAPPISATLAFGQSQATPLTLSNDGAQPLTVSVSTPPFEWSVANTGPATLYNLSAFAPLPLGDDMVYTDALDLGFEFPIYGALVNHLYLSSNGWVSAAKPTTSIQFAKCLPNNGLPTGTLAPFWADLDPSITGTVRAGRVASDTFVVSFDKVPLWHEKPAPTDSTYTFQAALHANGKVDFLYGNMGVSPAQWSVGVSLNSERGQNIACHRAPQALTGRSWTLANQAWPPLWLNGTPPNLALPPGSLATVVATLSGLDYLPWRTDPFASVLRLATNDPLQPVVDVPAQLLISTPAPYTGWITLVRR